MPQHPAPIPGAEPRILFQKFFKSVGPRTYAAQVKQAGNGNHFLVLTEGKRDQKTQELRKTRLFVFSEDFEQFLKMIDQAAQFIREHPLPEHVRQQRQRFWARQSGGDTRSQRQPSTKRLSPKPAVRQ